LKSNYHNLLPIVVTAKEMTEIDRQTIENVGIPGMVLMENAGRQVVSVIQKILTLVDNKRIVVFCGKGNNGGDGFVVSRYLLDLGAQVKTFLIGDPRGVKGDALINLKILNRLGHNVLHDVNINRNLVKGAYLIVDALLGTGVSGALRGKIAKTVGIINQSDAPVVAVDLPTGMNTDTGAVDSVCVNASATVTMAHIKRGLLFSPAREHAGKIHVADIGMPKQTTLSQGVNCFQLNKKFVMSVLPKRAPNSYKNDCGKLFVVAGSVGLTGAAVLSSAAAMRSGVGMTLLGIPNGLNVVMEERLTEVMTLPLPETAAQSVGFDAKEEISKRLPWADVLAIGPGLSTEPETAKLVKWVLQNVSKPIVVDADALNCMQDAPQLFKHAKGSLVLTPHPGELSRLVGRSTKEIVGNPIEAAKEAAEKFNSIVLLKTAPAVIASPDGIIFINSTGNPGMATAGMGDVLTGVVASLIAQGVLPLNAALAAVYLHGVAGDIAESKRGQVGLIARDVLNNLPRALKSITDDCINDCKIL